MVKTFNALKQNQQRKLSNLCRLAFIYEEGKLDKAEKIMNSF